MQSDMEEFCFIESIEEFDQIKQFQNAVCFFVCFLIIAFLDSTIFFTVPSRGLVSQYHCAFLLLLSLRIDWFLIKSVKIRFLLIHDSIFRLRMGDKANRKQLLSGLYFYLNCKGKLRACPHLLLFSYLVKKKIQW